MGAKFSPMAAASGGVLGISLSPLALFANQ
jgi:hypothetical protein